MDEQTFDTVETTTDETFDYDEPTENSNGGSGWIGALIGAGVVALGAAGLKAIKRNQKVATFIESRKAARKEKAMQKWLDHGIKHGYIDVNETQTEEK